MSDFADFPDLAAERLGGAALAANDEFFAPKENLVRAGDPQWIEDQYTERGKWMDGWETRRRREPGHDWCVVRLGLPGLLRGAIVDTAHFKGNFPESCALYGLSAAPDTSAEELAALVPVSGRWIELVPRSTLEGDAKNRLAAAGRHRVTHVRLDIFPDGGVARLRLHGEPVPDWPSLEAPLDLAALAHGARLLDWSDRFFGAPWRMIQPGPSLGMFDGWETRRRRGPGHDWALLRLACEGRVERAEIDTAFFKGNAPGSCSLDGGTGAVGAEPPREWREILPPTELSPDALHIFSHELRDAGPLTHARLHIYPDGGVARLRLWGTPTAAGRAEATLGWLNALPRSEAAAALAACCAAPRWAQALAAARPFRDGSHLAWAAEEIWRPLGPDDWRQAFAAPPPLGPGALASGDGQAARWSAGEQAGARGAAPETLARLAAGNRRYQERFGHVFLLCATGRGADEMLAALESRLDNDPDRELRVAAEEQAKITHLRLRKLLGADPEPAGS